MPENPKYNVGKVPAEGDFIHDLIRTTSLQPPWSDDQGKTAPPKKTAPPPGSTPTQPWGKGQGTVSPQAQFSADFAQSVAQEQGELQSLPGAYQNAVSGINSQIKGESSGPNSALNAAISGASQAAMLGEAGVNQAAAQPAEAGNVLAQDIPYTDVLSSLLVGKRNELQYGSTNLGTVNTANWTNQLQGIYNYLTGSASPNTPNPGAVGSGGGTSIGAYNVPGAGNTLNPPSNLGNTAGP